MFKHFGISFSIFCILILMPVLAAAQTVEPPEGPLLIFSETSYDFKNVPEDTVVTHIFEFSNMGTDTLFIKRVTGS